MQLLPEMPESVACPASAPILDEEIKAWSLYWIATFEKAHSQAEIEDLKKNAQGKTTALRQHVQTCPVCQRSSALTCSCDG